MKKILFAFFLLSIFSGNILGQQKNCYSDSTHRNIFTDKIFPVPPDFSNIVAPDSLHLTVVLLDSVNRQNFIPDVFQSSDDATCRFKVIAGEDSFLINKTINIFIDGRTFLKWNSPLRKGWVGNITVKEYISIYGEMSFMTCISLNYSLCCIYPPGGFFISSHQSFPIR
jgi:hypothetical protein